MRILIITAWYYPFIHPRPHRWTHIAGHWASEGHDIQVLTARRRGYPHTSTHEGVRVHRTGFDSLKELFFQAGGEHQARGRTGTGVRPPAWWLRWATRAYKFFWKSIYFPDDACIWYVSARMKALQLLREQPFDALVTVSLPFTGQVLGHALKRRYPHLRWLSDIGDPFAFAAFPVNNYWLYGRWNRQLEKATLYAADRIVVTTPHTKHQYGQHYGRDVTEKITVIPPLLHPEPKKCPERVFCADGKCRIGYFGALYAPVRTPDALLALIERTLQEKPEWRNTLEVHFYGDIFPEFYDALRACPVIHLHGLQERTVVQEAFCDMDILLNIGNQTDFQLPGKAVEYAASGKPVINLSYTSPDPFADFLQSYPALLHLRISGGKISAEDFAEWLRWIAQGPPPVSFNAVSLATYRELFSVSSIATAYMACLSTETELFDSIFRQD